MRANATLGAPSRPRAHAAASSVGSPVTPIAWWAVLLCFGIPALIFRAVIYVGMPALVSAGLASFAVYLVAFGGFLILLLLAAFTGYRLEGRAWTWAAVRQRFRLEPLHGKDWEWVVAGFAVAGGGYMVLAFTERQLARLPSFTPPPVLAHMDPRPASSWSYAGFMGVQTLGNWPLWLCIVLLLVLNIVAEEMWWRGYLLPRQAAAMGRSAWFVNGVLWTLFHAVFYPWIVISYLPICLSIPYVSQRRGRTQAGMAIHFTLNSFDLLLPITLGVLGIAS